MITENDKEVIYKWLDNLSLSRPKRNIERDFSDAVLMAEVLKKYYPRIVELHSYAPASGKAQKITNWSLLNRKVLCKLNLLQTREMIENLATSSPGAILNLLKNVYYKIEADNMVSSENEECAGDDSDNDPGGQKESVLPNRRKKCEKMVSAAALSQKVQELSEKEEIICRLTNKVAHLESLIHLKDQRINDLSAQLLRYQDLV